MKKQILSLMVVGMSLFTFNAYAQNQATQRIGQKAKTECPVAQECCEQNVADGQCPDNCCDGLFEGITLSAEQQAKIKDLQSKCAAQNKNNSKARKEARKESREKAANDRRSGKRQYLNEMKQILTPEQYVTFLENMALNGPGRPAGVHGKDMKRVERRHDRRHDGAPRKMEAKKSSNSTVISGSAKKSNN